MIDRVIIQNFRCLKDVDISLSNFNVIIGPNDSGKSSFLNAIMMLRGLLGNPGTGYPYNYPLSVWQQNSKEQVCFSVCQNQEKYKVRFQGFDYLSCLNKEGILSEKKDWEELEYIDRVVSSSLLGLEKYKHWQQLFSGIKKHVFDPQELRKPTLYMKISEGLGSNGFGLAGYLAALKLEEDEIFFKIVEALKKEIPRIKSINTPFNDQSHQYSLSFTTSDTNIKVPAELWSDGALLFLAYLTLLYSPSPPSVILIEEPENGVHPSRLGSIVSYLKKLSRTEYNGIVPQIIMTTHSPILLDEVRAEDVLVFYRQKKDGATTAKRLCDIPKYQEAPNEYYLGEFWTSFGEEHLMEDSE